MVGAKHILRSFLALNRNGLNTSSEGIRSSNPTGISFEELNRPLNFGPKIPTPDACYDRGSRFRLERFLNDRAPQPKLVGNTPHLFLHDDSRRVPRP